MRSRFGDCKPSSSKCGPHTVTQKCFWLATVAVFVCVLIYALGQSEFTEYAPFNESLDQLEQSASADPFAPKTPSIEELMRRPGTFEIGWPVRFMTVVEPAFHLFNHGDYSYLASIGDADLRIPQLLFALLLFAGIALANGAFFSILVERIDARMSIAALFALTTVLSIHILREAERILNISNFFNYDLRPVLSIQMFLADETYYLSWGFVYIAIFMLFFPKKLISTIMGHCSRNARRQPQIVSSPASAA